MIQKDIADVARPRHGLLRLHNSQQWHAECIGESGFAISWAGDNPHNTHREIDMVGNSVGTSVGHSSVYAEDAASVRSRISWGAIVAGSVLALALYFLLTLLGGAIGFSIGDKTSAQSLGVAAAVWAIVVTAACLFAGGFVASQLTVGENKREAAAYGLLVWALVFAMLLWLMATGVKAGFNAMVGVATTGVAVGDAAAKNTTQEDWETLARRAGVEQTQIDSIKQRAKESPAQAKAAAEDPETKRKADQAAREVGDAATRVTWYTFLGTLISMLAAAAGGYMGAGTNFRLFAVPVRTPNNKLIVS